MKSLPLLTLLVLSNYCYAQLPKTEIWVFDLKQTRMGYNVSNPIKVVAGNQYNNQPYFTQDGEVMYFVSNGKKGGKTDIYKYDFNKKRRKIKRITRTKKEAEYSPMLIPDQSRISCVRVAADTITQNFCTYNLKGKKPKILFPEIKTFGYYCWKSQIDLIAFHVPEPFTLIRHNFPYNRHDSLYPNIGRCLVNNRGKILYVDKSDSTQWNIKLLNNKRLGRRKYETLEPDRIISATLPEEEDFALARGKDLLMGKNGFVYIKENVFKDPNAKWKAILDLSRAKIYSFYRIAVSPVGNKLAVVSYTGKKP